MLFRISTSSADMFEREERDDTSVDDEDVSLDEEVDSVSLVGVGVVGVASGVEEVSAGLGDPTALKVGP